MHKMKKEKGEGSVKPWRERLDWRVDNDDDICIVWTAEYRHWLLQRHDPTLMWRTKTQSSLILLYSIDSAYGNGENHTLIIHSFSGIL